MNQLFFQINVGSTAAENIQRFCVSYLNPWIFQKFKNCLMHCLDLSLAEDLNGSSSQWNYSHSVISPFKSNRLLAGHYQQPTLRLARKVADFFQP
jgi:hypothetical protein